MESCEPTSLLLSRIKAFDPENATRVLGFLLYNGFNEKDLTSLLLGPETALQSLIFEAKSRLGLSSNTFRAPISRPNLAAPINNGGHPFHLSSPRPSQTLGCSFDLQQNPSSPSPWSGPVHVPVPVQVQPFLNRDDGDDLIDESELSETLSFLDESVEPLNDLGTNHFHRRSYSESDACFGSGDGGLVVSGGFGFRFRPCLYHARGYCKKGSHCEFVHGGFEQRDEAMRLKFVEQQRLAEMSRLGLLQQQNGLHRSAALAMQEQLHRFGPLRPERKDCMMAGLASRQIYLTFPPDSSFRDEDIFEYFGNYGPVQEVRIPYQQKRMFGFVTFVLPETARLILARGSPHFICGSRVLVKPYKEKGAVLDRRHQFQHQQIDRGDYLGCLSPSGIDDLHLGARNLYGSHDMVLRRKLEEADLQRAIELEARRLVNLHLPELDDQTRHQQRSFSVGVQASLSEQTHNHAYHDVSEEDEDSPAAQQTVRALVHNTDSGNSKESASPLENDDHQSIIEHLLSDSVFGSPTKSATLSNVEETNATENDTSPPISLAVDMAPR